MAHAIGLLDGRHLLVNMHTHTSIHLHAVLLFAKVTERIFGILLNSTLHTAATELWGGGERLDRLCANLKVDRRWGLSRCKRYRHVSIRADGLGRDGLDGGGAVITAFKAFGNIGKGITGV